MSRQTIAHSGALVALSTVLFSGQANAQAVPPDAGLTPGTVEPFAGLVLPIVDLVQTEPENAEPLPQVVRVAGSENSFLISPALDGIPFPEEPGPNTIVTFNIRLSPEQKSRFGGSGAGMPRWPTRVPADKADLYLGVIRAVTELERVSPDIEGLENVPRHARNLLHHFASLPDSQVYIGFKDRTPSEIAGDPRLRSHWDDPRSSWPNMWEQQVGIMRRVVSDTNRVVFNNPRDSFQAAKQGVLEALERNPVLMLSPVFLIPVLFLLRERRLAKAAESRESAE